MRNRRLHTLIMVSLTPLYAICFVAIRIGLAYAPPLAFATLRVLLAGVALLALAWWRSQPLWIPRQHWPALLLLTLSSGVIGYGTMFLSPGPAGAGIASVLGNTQPLAVIVLAALLLHERLTWHKVVALAAGILGVVLISAAALESASAAGLVGSLLALASAVAFGASTIVVARLAPKSPLLALTAWQFLLASLPLAGLSLVTERQITQFWNPIFLVIVAVLALFGTALTTSVWYWLVQRDNAGRLSLLLFLVPVLGVGLAVLTLGEQIGWREGVGILLTVSGVLLALRSDDHDAAEKPSTGASDPLLDAGDQ
ncbi:MAG TPA: DMT family transporter [Ktedonobacterales bacterium]|nr:DMT family transporter [Ktedonobacterales bacterium]